MKVMSRTLSHFLVLTGLMNEVQQVVDMVVHQASPQHIVQGPGAHRWWYRGHIETGVRFDQNTRLFAGIPRRII